jgi:hypothetical protein
VNPNALVVDAPVTLVAPNGSYVYSVWTVPEPSSSATEFPSASVR